MSDFQLDTSGFVENPDSERDPWVWEDLTPFAKGYVEALFRRFDTCNIEAKPEWGHRWSSTGRCERCGVPITGENNTPTLAFSDLAPATLARIIADCELKAATLAGPLTAQDGGAYWRKFMSNTSTVSLSDDGKVVFQ